MEEERPSGPAGSGKQRAEDKDLSGPYESDEDKSDYNLVVDEVSRGPASDSRAQRSGHSEWQVWQSVGLGGKGASWPPLGSRWMG